MNMMISYTAFLIAKIFTFVLYLLIKYLLIGNLRSEALEKDKIMLSLVKSGPGFKRMGIFRERRIGTFVSVKKLYFGGTFDEIKIVNAAIDETVEKLLKEWHQIGINKKYEKIDNFIAMSG
ncbi:hypothetical protein ACJX0J_037628, partial [Zea mays]